MNYAALIALLAALAFSLPFLVNLAEQAGIARNTGVITTLTAAVLVLAFIVIRGRMQRRQAIEARIEAIGRQRQAAPHDPEAFFMHGDHLGDLLLTVGRLREALAAFTAYRQVAQQAGRDVTAVSQAIATLEARLHEEGGHASL
ncbi:MAG: hypothetical protein KGZ35_03485 [Truepera sp.]|nr:hypothetical protein [Truepera sp.]